ncbi:MAG: hypothetical protein E6K49_13860, partial [Gammaproteobacteria bacterium]
MNTKCLIAATATILAAIAPLTARAQALLSEDFTGGTNSNSWYSFNGACLTAGSSSGSITSTGNTSYVISSGPGQIPSCLSIVSSYYNQNLVGGQNGVSGSTQTLPDPVGQGALRFTNGAPGGYSQNGAIVSGGAPFPAGAGIQVTFKTVTYRGNSGGAGGDGADGISFYMMDGSQSPNLGAWGGSLGYTCSNANPPYNGLIGGYLAVGVDEYGNFLNGASLMPGYGGSNSATGDNTASGYGYKPGRIGMRGAGSIAWTSLSGTYPALFPSSWTTPQQQAAVRNTCRSGVLEDYNGTQLTYNGST